MCCNKQNGSFMYCNVCFNEKYPIDKELTYILYNTIIICHNNMNHITEKYIYQFIVYTDGEFSIAPIRKGIEYRIYEYHSAIKSELGDIEYNKMFGELIGI